MSNDVQFQEDLAKVWLTAPGNPPCGPEEMEPYLKAIWDLQQKRIKSLKSGKR